MMTILCKISKRNGFRDKLSNTQRFINLVQKKDTDEFSEGYNGFGRVCFSLVRFYYFQL